MTGTGPDLPSWVAFLAGITGGLVFFLISGLLRLNKVDDPVHGIGVHISGGVVGTFLVGLSNLVVTRDGMSVVRAAPRGVVTILTSVFTSGLAGGWSGQRGGLELCLSPPHPPPAPPLWQTPSEGQPGEGGH